MKMQEVGLRKEDWRVGCKRTREAFYSLEMGSKNEAKGMRSMRLHCKGHGENGEI